MTRLVRALPAVLFAGLAACGPLPGASGAGCAQDSDCPGGVCYTGFAGGYCSQRCEDTACPGDTRCAALAQGSFCLQNCSIGALECRSGYYCADVSAGSVCFPECTSNADCGPGASCGADKKCTTGLPGATGAECLLNVGCTTGRCEVAFSGGVCTQPCGQSSEGSGSFNQSCAEGSSCASVSEAGGLCLANCTTDANCRADYTCQSGVCKAKCRGAANCGVGESCNKSTGVCIEGSAGPRQTGAACGSDADCDVAYCLTEAGQQFPKGYCSDDCTGDASKCGANGLCIVPSDPMFASVCLQKCTSNFDCRADYFCSGVQGDSARICIPRCTAVDICTAPQVCDTFSGDCVNPGQPGSSTISRVALGTMSLSQQVTTKDFSIDVPADAVSFTVVMKGGVGGTSTISRLNAPNGELLFDLDNYLTSKVRILPVNDGDFATLFPNSPRVPLTTGKYTFTVYNEQGSGTGEVFALLKRNGGTLAGGKLNLNFWFAGLAPLTATSAGADPKFQEALTEFRTIYKTAGIDLGEINYFDVPAGQQAMFSTIDTTDGKDSELRKLFELSKGATNNAMNFFLVKSISGGGAGFVILGVAGGIPGIPFEQGTNASGVAVTADDLASDPKSVARTMAHEGGHWLGLWHLTEQSGQMFDPLSDTPECPETRDSNKDKKVTSPECVGFGADYLMFWQAGPTASKLSGNQGFVLQRNPVVSQ